MSGPKRDLETWRRAVYAHPDISDSTRVLLLLLSEYMRADLTVSVPRSTLVKRLGQSHRAATFERRIADRLREAVGEKPESDPEAALRNRQTRLLDRKVKGQRHVTAVYQGLMPNEALQDVRQPAENVAKRPAETAIEGSLQDVSEPAISRPDLSRLVGDDDEERSNEAPETPEAAASVAVCEWHDHEHPCPPDCRNHPTNREATA